MTFFFTTPTTRREFQRELEARFTLSRVQFTPRTEVGTGRIALDVDFIDEEVGQFREDITRLARQFGGVLQDMEAS